MSRPTPSATERASVAERLAGAIAGRDRGALRSLFTTPLRFRAVTPRRFWDAETPVEVEDIVFGHWFPDGVAVTSASLLRRDPVEGTGTFGHRIRVDTPGGAAVIEQVGYYRLTGDRISDLHLACSGFQRV